MIIMYKTFFFFFKKKTFEHVIVLNIINLKCTLYYLSLFMQFSKWASLTVLGFLSSTAGSNPFFEVG